MKTIKLDKTHDLYYEKGKLVYIDGIDAYKQRLKISLGTILGEWYRNKEAGLPYKEEILIKKPNIQRIENLIRIEILRDPETVNVVFLNLAHNKINRSLTVTGEVLSVYGVVNIGVV